MNRLALIATGVAATVALSAAMVASRAADDPAPADDPVARLGLVPSFAEEFDGDRLDPKRWNSGRDSDPIQNRSLYNNGERQLYLHPGYFGINQTPLTLAGGLLTITAKPLTAAERSVVQAQVRALPPPLPDSALKDIAYGSGALDTRGHFEQRYGYFEMRARFPQGRGLWPAFWLLPADGSWPPEIDIVEVLGHDLDTIYTTLHLTGVPQRGHSHRIAPTADGFHRYGALWSPTSIDFYVDGVRVGSETPTPEFRQPMYIFTNLAVGGYWPGYPDAATRFPARMEVDYIRAWRYPKPPRG